jgi:hypothetical protein
MMPCSSFSYSNTRGVTFSFLVDPGDICPQHIPNCTKPSTLNLEVFWDRLPKKKMHLIGMDNLLILLSLGLGYHHPRGQDITIHPLRRPTSLSVNPNPGTSPLSHVCVSSVVIYHAMWPLQAHMRHAPYTRTPNPHTTEKPRGSALIPLVTPRPISDRRYLLLTLSRIIYCPHRPTRVFCAHFVLTHAHPRELSGRSPIPNCSKPSMLNLEVLSR